MNILFICTGNTCRSPMAEAYLSKISKTDNIKVLSAGTSTIKGLPASEYTYKVLAENSIEFSNHQSRVLDDDIINSSHLILTMTQNHKIQVIQQFPEISHKVYTLKEYAADENTGKANNQNDISDPFGCSKSKYEETFLEIKDNIDMIVTKNKL